MSDTSIKSNVSFFKVIFISISLILIIFLNIKDKDFFVKADYFGKYNDAYYCKFIPAIGIFLGKQIDNSIQYDSSLLKGLDRIFINSHDIRSLADIYIGNPHRKNVALNVAAPPGRQVILGFWGYNYAQHDVNVKKIFIPLDIKEQNNSISDLTRILQFETNKNSFLKNLNVSYRVLGKTYTRMGKYFVINKNILFKNNVFYKGIAIGQAQIKPAVEVIQQVTECIVNKEGEQQAIVTYKVRNFEPIMQKIKVRGKEYIINPKVTRTITYVEHIQEGEEKFNPTNIKFSILSQFVQCINMKSSSGLAPNPKTKNLMVLRDDLSYNSDWRGTQPGFSVPYIGKPKVLCVTRIPYGFYSKPLGCKFVPLINLSMKMNSSCIDFSNWRELTIRIKNNGILLRDLKLKINVTDSNGNEIKKVEYYYKGSIYRSSLRINVSSIKALKNKDIKFKIRFTGKLPTSRGLVLKVRIDENEVIRGITNTVMPLKLCKKDAKLKQQIKGCIKANDFQFNQKIILTGDQIKNLLDSQIKIKLKYIVGDKEFNKVQLVLAKSQYLLPNKKINAEYYMHNKEVSCNLLQNITGYYSFLGGLELWIKGVAKGLTPIVDLVSWANIEFFGNNISNAIKVSVLGCSTDSHHIGNVKPVTPGKGYSFEKVQGIKDSLGKNTFNYFFDFGNLKISNLKITSTLGNKSKTTDKNFINKSIEKEPLDNSLFINSKKGVVNSIVFTFIKIIAIISDFLLKKRKLSYIIKYLYIEDILTISFILFLGIRQIISELNKKPHLFNILNIRCKFNTKFMAKSVKLLRKSGKGV